MRHLGYIRGYILILYLALAIPSQQSLQYLLYANLDLTRAHN
jgi:hypothetical protein